MAISAVYKGTEFFTQPNATHNPVNPEDGAGTAEEFSLPLDYYNPRMLALAPPIFIKPGIGSFFRPVSNFYKCNDPYFPDVYFPWTHKTENDSHVFEQHAVGLYIYRKTISLNSQTNTFKIEYQMTNTSNTVIETSQYSHNFISIGGTQPGPAYEIEFNEPVEFQFEKYQDNKILFEGRKVRIEKIPRVFFARFLSNSNLDTVDIYNKKLNRGLRIFTSSPFIRQHLYISPKLISPEFFIPVLLKPGEAKTWVRSWQFYNK